jgi:gamma-glutamylputrescine oxidase
MLMNNLRLTQRSYYEASVTRPAVSPCLGGDVRCDVAIVGAGLAGLSAALDLAQAGYQVVVLEANTVGWGASGRNGGQALTDVACGIEAIEKILGFEAARQVWQTSVEAVALVKQRITEHTIDCDWQDGYLSAAVSPKKARYLMQFADMLEQRYGYQHLTRISPQDVGKHIASPRFHSALRDDGAGHLHPLKFTLGMARAARAAGVIIYENTAVRGLTQAQAQGRGQGAASAAPCVLNTAQGKVSATQVLLAGNVTLGQGEGKAISAQLNRRIMPVGTYIVASEPLGQAQCRALIPSNAAVCDTNFVLDYFRFTADHRCLFGGQVSYTTATPLNLTATMHARMAATFPALKTARIDYAWGGFVDITVNRAPDFGRLAHNVYYLQGFCGHGVALTGMAGRMVARAMQGDSERLDVFAKIPHLPFWGGALLRTPALVLGMQWFKLKDWF